jgi:uncharacterized membrane protein (UPF0127 family)
VRAAGFLFHGGGTVVEVDLYGVSRGRLASMKKLAVAILIVLATACSGDGGQEPEEQPDSALRRGTAIVETDDGAVLVRVEIADTPETREKGLMGRESLDDDEGMVFLFFEETSGGFWMKNTLIPLSIAFFGQDGRILEILDMDPCEEDPCPIYDPGLAYRGAVEMDRGAFDRLGIEVGDEIRVSP